MRGRFHLGIFEFIVTWHWHGMASRMLGWALGEGRSWRLFMSPPAISDTHNRVLGICVCTRSGKICFVLAAGTFLTCIEVIVQKQDCAPAWREPLDIYMYTAHVYMGWRLSYLIMVTRRDGCLVAVMGIQSLERILSRSRCVSLCLHGVSIQVKVSTKTCFCLLNECVIVMDHQVLILGVIRCWTEQSPSRGNALLAYQYKTNTWMPLGSMKLIEVCFSAGTRPSAARGECCSQAHRRMRTSLRRAAHQRTHNLQATRRA